MNYKVCYLNGYYGAEPEILVEDADDLTTAIEFIKSNNLDVDLYRLYQLIKGKAYPIAGELEEEYIMAELDEL